METNKYNNDYIVSKKNISIIGIVCLIAGVAAFYGSTITDNSTLTMTIIVVGLCLALIGFIKLFMGQKCYYCKECGKKMRLTRVMFNKDELNKLQRCIEEKKFDAIGSLRRGEDKSSDIRLDIYSSADKQTAVAQIMHFVPFEYQAATPAVVLTGQDAEYFINLFA